MIQVLSFDVGLRNLAVCILMHNKGNEYEIKHWENIDLLSKKNDVLSVQDSLIDVVNMLFENYINHDIETHVIIEQQMTATMRCLQASLSMYIKVLKLNNTFKIGRVAIINPKLKMKLIDHFPNYIKPQLTLANTKNRKYQQNKVDSVNFTKWFLQHVSHDQLALNMFENVGKKDDYSDCFIQSIAWLTYAYKSI